MANKMIGSIHGIHCAGCRYSFEYYEMSADEAYSQDGKLYCCSDCEMESSLKESERDEWSSLSDEY